MRTRAVPVFAVFTAVLAATPMLACDRGKAGAEEGSKSAAEDAPAASTDASAANGEGEAGASDEGKATGADDSGAAKPSAPAKDGKTRAAEAKAAAKAGGAEAKSARVRFVKLLNDGRKAVKDKRYEDGIDLYFEALELDPDNPKLLGELGFAALKIGELEFAESWTRRAIDLAPPGHPSLGALYYNLGLISEKRERPAVARTAYERSLEVRPGNEIVAGKLARLDNVSATGPAKAAELCAALREQWSCYETQEEIEALLPEDQEYAGECSCSVKKQIEEGSGESFIEAAALLELTGSESFGGILEETYLVVRTAGEGWQLIGQLTSGYSPGMMGISNYGEIPTFEFVDLALAPGEELRVVASTSEVDSNMGINTIDFSDYGVVTVCYESGGESGSCAHFPSSRASGTEILFEGEPCDEQLGEERWALDIVFGDSEVTVTRKAKDDDLPTELVDLVGTRSFAEAVIYPAVSHTKLH